VRFSIPTNQILPFVKSQNPYERKEETMNKKIIFVTIALLVIASMALSACGGAKTPTTVPATVAPATAAPATAVPPTAAPEPVTLKVWHNWGPDDAKGPAMKSIFADFMAANPDVIIADEVYVDADIPLKLETSAAAGQEPELVFSGGIGSAMDWVKNGTVVPVNDLIDQWGLSDKFLASGLSQYTDSEGSIIAFPIEGFTWPIWYNTKVFKAAGVEVPQTTDELIAAAAAIRAAGYGGPLIASGADDMGGYVFQLILQSAMTDEEAKASMGAGDWTIPNAIKGVELFVQLRDAGVFVDGVEGVDYAGAEAKFGAGGVGMCHYGAWAFADEAMLPLIPDIQIGGFPLPAGSPHTQPVYYKAFSAKGIFITPNGAAKMDAVEKFVKFMFQPEMIARFVEQAGMNPSITGVTVDESKLNPLFAQTLDMDAEVVAISDAYMPGAVKTDFLRITQEAFTNGTTAEQLLADLTAAYQAIK
jgi:multiple sugar transport system substrate-binding protein